MAHGPYKLEGVDPDAWDFAMSQPENIQRQIAEKIQFVLEDPYRAGTRQLSGAEWVRRGFPVRRIRSGDYRILYCADLEAREVTIIAIGHRRDIYDGRRR
jgi:mRNA interferase RelE/StbE